MLLISYPFVFCIFKGDEVEHLPQPAPDTIAITAFYFAGRKVGSSMCEYMLADEHIITT